MALKIICDKCKENAGGVAYDILIRSLHNPVPINMNDTSEPAATHDNTHIRMVLCQNCYRKFNLPNIYKSKRAGEIIFRDNGENVDAENSDTADRTPVDKPIEHPNNKPSVKSFTPVTEEEAEKAAKEFRICVVLDNIKRIFATDDQTELLEMFDYVVSEYEGYPYEITHYYKGREINIYDGDVHKDEKHYLKNYLHAFSHGSVPCKKKNSDERITVSKEEFDRPRFSIRVIQQNNNRATFFARTDQIIDFVKNLHEKFNKDDFFAVYEGKGVVLYGEIGDDVTKDIDLMNRYLKGQYLPTYPSHTYSEPVETAYTFQIYHKDDANEIKLKLKFDTEDALIKAYQEHEKFAKAFPDCECTIYDDAFKIVDGKMDLHHAYILKHYFDGCPKYYPEFNEKETVYESKHSYIVGKFFSNAYGIKPDDKNNTFICDAELVKRAQMDGVPLIPIEALPKQLRHKHMFYIDTPQNRARLEIHSTCFPLNFFGKND